MASAHGVRLPFTFLLEPSPAEPRIYSTGVAALQAPRLGARARSHAGSVGARRGACRHRPLPSFVPFHPSPLHHRDLLAAPIVARRRSIRSAGRPDPPRWGRSQPRRCTLSRGPGGGGRRDATAARKVPSPPFACRARRSPCFERERERKRQSSRAVNQLSLAIGHPVLRIIRRRPASPRILCRPPRGDGWRRATGTTMRERRERLSSPSRARCGRERKRRRQRIKRASEWRENEAEKEERENLCGHRGLGVGK